MNGTLTVVYYYKGVHFSSVSTEVKQPFSGFQMLEENIFSFVKNELKKIQNILSPGYPKNAENLKENEEVLESDEEERKSTSESFLRITVDFLKRMKQQELADRLQFSKRILTQWKAEKEATEKVDISNSVCIDSTHLHHIYEVFWQNRFNGVCLKKKKLTFY